MTKTQAFIFGFTNVFDANILRATSLRDRKTMMDDFYKKSEKLRKYSDEKYNAEFKEIAKQK